MNEWWLLTPKPWTNCPKHQNQMIISHNANLFDRIFELMCMYYMIGTNRRNTKNTFKSWGTPSHVFKSMKIPCNDFSFNIWYKNKILTIFGSVYLMDLETLSSCQNKSYLLPKVRTNQKFGFFLYNLAILHHWVQITIN